MRKNFIVFIYLFFLMLVLTGCGGEKQYLITMVNNNDTRNTVIKKDYELSILPPTQPTKDGYYFVYWCRDKQLTERYDFTNMPKKNITVYAKWEPNNYSIKFYLDDVVNYPNNIIYYNITTSVDLYTPTKVNYDFLGWYTNPGLSGDVVTSIPEGSFGNISLFAKWTKSIYTVEFDCMITSNLPISQGEYLSKIELPIPTKSGYTFLGWRDNTSLYPKGEYLIKSNVVLTAVWEGLSNGFLFTIDNSEVSIKSYSGTSTHLIVPNTIEGLPVVSIEENSFQNNKTLKTVKIGKFTRFVDNQAFNFVENLESIEFPNEATSFGFSVLRGCYSLKNIVLSSEANYELKYYFGNSVNYIPNKLETIRFASGGNTINTKFLKSDFKDAMLILASDTTKIIAEQFKDVTYLKTVLIPNTVTSIGKDAFLNASSLIIFAEASSKPMFWNNTWNTSDRPVIWGYLKTVIKNSVEYAISNKGFAYVLGQENTSTASNITILDTVENCSVVEILYSAFYNNIHIKYITIPSSIKHIGDNCFLNARSLIEFSFTKDIQLISIGQKAFYQANNLSSIIIPSSVTSIGQNAFKGADMLVICAAFSSQPITWDSQWNPDDRPVIWGITDFLTINSIEYILASDNKAYVLRQQSNSVITDITILGNIGNCEVVKIFEKAFYNNTVIKNIFIPASIEVIGEYTFANATNLISVTFEKNSKLSVLENHIFSETTSLENIVMPDNIVNIKYRAFYKASSLQNIIIPASVVIITNNAFELATNLTSVTFEENSNLETIGGFAFYRTNLISIHFPASITTIGSSAFSYLKTLTSVTFEENSKLTTIGSFAFIKLTGITSLIIPEGVVNIGSSAFCELDNLKSVIIPASVTNIGELAFCSYKDLTVYAEAESKPEGWKNNWDWGNVTVIWGYIR